MEVLAAVKKMHTGKTTLVCWKTKFCCKVHAAPTYVRMTLACRSHKNSFCITIRTLTSRLYIRTTWVSQTHPTQCAFLKFEFLHSQC